MPEFSALIARRSVFIWKLFHINFLPSKIKSAIFKSAIGGGGVILQCIIMD